MSTSFARSVRWPLLAFVAVALAASGCIVVSGHPSSHSHSHCHDRHAGKPGKHGHKHGRGHRVCHVHPHGPAHH